MIEVDGSSGGGSILRIAVPVGIASNEPMRITNIRKKRSTPGLRQQHLQGVQLLAALTGTQLNGAKVGSTIMEIYPHELEPQHQDLVIPTAGAVSLVFQLLSNYITMSNSSLDLEFSGGGTHTKWSPNFDYLQQVTLPVLKKFGQSANITMTTPGYYPKGGAQGRINISGYPSKMVELTGIRGNTSGFSLVSRVSEDLKQAQVAERQIKGFKAAGVTEFIPTIYYDQTRSTGTALTAIANTGHYGFSELGQKGVRAEDIGKNVAHAIQAGNFAASVDEYLADQLMLPLSQAPTGSNYTLPRITNHVSSNLELINSLLDNPLQLEEQDSVYLLQKV